MVSSYCIKKPISIATVRWRCSSQISSKRGGQRCLKRLIKTLMTRVMYPGLRHTWQIGQESCLGGKKGELERGWFGQLPLPWPRPQPWPQPWDEGWVDWVWVLLAKIGALEMRELVSWARRDSWLRKKAIYLLWCEGFSASGERSNYRLIVYSQIGKKEDRKFKGGKGVASGTKRSRKGGGFMVACRNEVQSCF